MKVLMVGVDESTKGGMWTVVENYLQDEKFVNEYELDYVPTCLTGCSAIKKILFTSKAFIKIHSLFKKNNYSILHVHMAERASIIRKGIIMNYAKKRGLKIVLHMHGAEFEVLYKKMNLKKQKKVKNILNLADKVIVLGEYWKDFIESLVDDKSKICVVYNAVNVPSNNLYNQNSNSILFLGVVSKRKGIDIFIKALNEHSENLKDKCVVNIYGPDKDGNIEEIIKSNGLEKWVKYCGWLKREGKPEVFKNTAINVLPSYNEGLPMTILETMAYGIPSITTNVAAIPEAVNKDNGIVINPGDYKALGSAIEELILNKEKRIKLSEKSYEDAKEKFSIEKHIQEIEKIYNELV